MKTRKQRWLILCAGVLCLLTLCIGVGREVYLNHIQDAALEVLDSRSGEYDTQSIMLTGTNVGRANELAEMFSAELRITEDGSFAALTLPEGVTIRDVYAQRENRELLDELTVDYRASITDLTGEAETAHHRHYHHGPRYPVNDDRFESQSYLDYMNLDTVWETTQGNGILVAVIDTGIDTDHPEFSGRISEYSYNATTDKIVKDYDWSLIEDEQGHGTAVAGVVAAAMDGSGTVGVAPGVELLVIKAECDENGTFYRTSDLVFGLYYAVERGANVVNMSFGAYSSEDPFADAAQLAYDSDILCVAAAGNDATTQLTYPAASENVLGVGALADGSWELAAYSNYGDNVNLVAPGTVYTTLVDGEYGTMTGTSFSSPAVAGTLALYLSQNRYQTVDDVTEVLYASCADLGSLGEDWLFGYGAVDVSALVLEEKGTVTFLMQTDELDNLEQVFVRSHTLQDIPEPERLYAVFDGWYYDPQCTEEYQWYEDEFFADLTLYAKWANEDDSVPYTYVTLADGTVEIRSYTGHRRYITIPDTIDGKVVSSIGMGAFENESGLRQVNLPKDLKTVCENAFYGCTNLTEIYIPDSVKTIGDYAFYGNTRLYTVALGSGLENIGEYAFSGCVSLARFEIREKLSSMDGTALFGATSLQSIGVRSGNRSFAAKDGVLFNKSGTTLVVYPAGKSGDYTVPGSVHTIGVCAFGYTRASQVDLNRVQTIGDSAFAYSRLTSVAIPDSVTSIGKGGFVYNSLLSQVEIGAGLREISDQCFAGCTMLSDIEIPANITGIGMAAFQDCSALKTVTFAGNSRLSYIGMNAFALDGLTAIQIPASVATIGGGAFSGNEKLASVVFERGSVLSTIGNQAFYKTSALTQVELPAHLRTIGEFAFAESGLTDVNIPASLTDFGAGAFASCHDLTQITVANGNAHYQSVDGVVYDTAMKTLVAYPAGKEASAFTIPDSVQTVGTAAFYGSHNLTGVTIPASVEILSEYSFYDCRNVTNYNVSEGLVDIMSYAFSGNSSLRSFDVPNSVMQISRFAFAEDYSLTSVSISENTSLPRLGYAAFAYTGLTEFRVPANISTMAQGVFEGCEDLRHIVFSAGSKLDAIGAYTFDGCDNLQSIVFESGSALTTISAHGFEGMRSLRTVDFGNAKLSEIGNFAFRFCENLTTFEVPETLVNIGRFAFYGCESLDTLTLPAGIEHIGSYAFHGAENLRLYFKADFLPLYLDENWDNDLFSYHVGVNEVVSSGDWEYAVHNSGNISIISYTGSAKSVNLNALSLGGDIVGIGGHAFYQSPVTEVVLPDTLTTIQAYAFAESALRQITIPASVNFIGRNAFSYSDLEQVTFEAGSELRVMEQEAFANTEKLTAITLPKSLTTLGSRVFFESGLESVAFEKGIALTEIPEQAFAGSALTAVTIPDSVTLINHSAFRDCLSLAAVTLGAGEDLYIASNVFYNTALRQVHIPANVSYIGEYAFVGLTNLQNFTVSEDNAWYAAVDGLLMSKDGRKLIAVPAACTGSLTVPASVEEIGFGAFENSKLSAVSFAPNGNILTLGYRAFYGAENLKSITIPASVVSIDYYAFANCTALERVVFAQGSRLTGVYEGAFYGCTNLSDITLPDTIVEISDFAFYGCRALAHIPVSDTAQLKGIYSYAFAYSGISGDFTTPEGLIDIGDYAFAGTDITTLTIPDTKQKELIIGIGAFENCGKLTEVTVPFIGASFEDPDITWFGYIFGAGSYEANNTYVPESLKTVTISEGITHIGRGAFWDLSNLENASIPHSVTSIGYEAFLGTTAKYELTNSIWIDDWTNGAFGRGLCGKVVIADGIERISNSLFADSAVEEVVIPNSVTEIGEYAFVNCYYLTKLVLPDSILSIGFGAFQSSSIRAIVLPDNLTEIPEHAFHGCKNLASVVIPEGVKLIGTYAFADSGLWEIAMPSTVETIGDMAFANCSTLYTVNNNSALDLEIGSTDNGYLTYEAKVIADRFGNKTYRDDVTQFEYIETPDGFRFKKENGEYSLIAYIGAEETVTLPLSFNGAEYTLYRFNGAKNVVIPDGVTEIGDYAFADSMTLRSVSIPDSVTKIGAYAFLGCGNLMSIEIPDSVQELGYAAFINCIRLADVSLGNGLTCIEANLFCGCNSLERVVIPDNVKVIQSYSFSSCGNLREVILPEGIESIYNDAFQSCTDLKRMHIPSSVAAMAGAFSGCKFDSFTIDERNPYFTEVDGVVYNREMTEIVMVLPGVRDVTIPASVIYFGSAFEGNKEIETVKFEKGSKITSIDLYAFSDCRNLKTVEIPDGVTKISHWAFSSCFSLQEIILPNSLMSLGIGAFQHCETLREIDIPSSVVNIGDNAFWGCRNLSSIMVSEGNPNYCTEGGILYNKAKTEIVDVPDGIQGKVVVADGITEIKTFDFSDCTLLGSVELPETVTKIGEMAFANCWKLKEINIPEAMNEIADEAFAGTYLYKITNQSSLQLEIGSTEHGGIAREAKVIVDGAGNETFAEGITDLTFIDTDDGFWFMRKNGEYILLAYLGDEETITLPASIDGNPYSLYQFTGGKNVIVPVGSHEIAYEAFYSNRWMESIVVPEGVTQIEGQAFCGCWSLNQISLPDGITWIDNWAFDAPVEVDSSGNWYADGYLLKVVEDSRHFKAGRDVRGIAYGAFGECHRLVQLETSVFSRGAFYGLTNLKTLVLSETPELSLHDCFSYQIPITLDTIVIRTGVDISNVFTFFSSGLTIFVEDPWIDSGAVWDSVYPGWNNGNKVYYGDEWITACFYDVNGEILEREFLLTSQIIRQPYYAIESDELYDYTFVGWDIDGDGLADHIPATSAVDIEAYPVVERSPRAYAVTFYDKDGITPIHVELLPYGSAVTLPADPEKPGYDFLGWIGYTEGMTVTGDVSIYSRWEHVGSGHDYSITEALAPSCTEMGGTLHICSLCGESYLTDHILPTGHNYSVSTVHGCDEMGYDLHSCTVCGDSYQDNFTAAAGHAYGGWSVLAEATCTEDGRRSRSCGHCGTVETEAIPAIPHTVTSVVTKETTCTEAGEMTHTCTVCGDMTVELLLHSAHNYEMKRVPMSFIEQLIRLLVNILWGYDGDTAYYFVCTDCGHIQTVEESTVQSSAAGAACTHTDAEWTVAYEPNCETEGVEWRVCGLCGEAIEARTFGTAGEGHAYAVESFDAERHHLACIGCGTELVELHSWNDSNHCDGCGLSGVAAVLEDKTLTIMLYHLPETDCTVIIAGYDAYDRMISCKFVEDPGSSIVEEFEQGNIADIQVFVVDSAWVPVIQPVPAAE